MSLYDKLPDDIKPLITKPASETGLKDYTFKLISQTEHSRGICWVGVIKHKGKSIVRVENEGNGGADHFEYTDDTNRKKIERFAKRVYPDDYEPISQLVALLDALSATVRS